MVLVIGTILAAGLNYAYNLLVNRLLLPADYATFAALLGVVALIGAPMGALQTIAAKYSADYMAEDDPGSVWNFLKRLSARVMPVGILLFVLFATFSSPLAHFVSNDDIGATVKGVVVVGFGLLFQLLLPLNRGMLQGTQSFVDLAVNLVADAFGRILLGLAVMLPLIGGGSRAALGSIMRGELKIENEWVIAASVGATVLGSLVSYLLSFRPVGRWAQKEPRHQVVNIAELVRFAWPTLLMYLFTTTLLTVDVILVKRYAVVGTGLTPDNAGEYATLSTLAKLIFYITGPIVTVMFPMIADLLKKQERHFPVLLTAMVSVLAGSGIVLGIFAVAPYFIISKLAPNYTSVSHLLVPMTVIFFVYSLTNLFANYFLSLKRYSFLLALALGGCLEILLVALYHGSMTQVIQMVTLAQTVTLVGLVWLYLYLKRLRLKETLQQIAARL